MTKDNDIKLWFRIKALNKKIDNLGEVGSDGFDWDTWYELVEESSKLYSELSNIKSIQKKIIDKYD